MIALGMEMGWDVEQEETTTHLPCLTQPWNSHIIFTTDVLSDLKHITLYGPQALSLDKSPVSEN